jgi:polysaccharide export outer membrane protein
MPVMRLILAASILATLAAAGDRHVIEPGDDIWVATNGMDCQWQPRRVGSDGMVNVSPIGPILAAGRTPSELKAAIDERLTKYLVNPDAIVSVICPGKRCYYVQGQVNHPGEFELLEPTRVLDALAKAGGLRWFPAGIAIIRDEERATKRLSFDYKKAMRGQKPEQNILLQPGDIIVVR